MNNTQEDLLSIFQAGLNAVAGKKVVKQELAAGNYKKYSHFVAIGKAAEAMLSGVPNDEICSALLISKHAHISEQFYRNDRITCIESDHPIPKSASLKAGEILLNYLENLPKSEPVLFLISGGASALVEFLEEGWDLVKLQELTDYLLSNAYSIDEMNAVRRRLSKIKGGGLWRYIGDRPVTCLMISDVPDDDPAVIGSGLLFPSKGGSLPALPKKWSEKLADYKYITVPNNFNWKIVACLDQAKKAAKTHAETLGYQVEIISEFLNKDAEVTAKGCVDILKKNKNILMIWGGETTVKLPKNAKKGGRNQHLALAAAIAMDGLKDTYLLSAGTDGSDGFTSATGAIVNGETVDKGLQEQINAKDYLRYADSNSYFMQIGGLIETGSTGTNVMDLVLGISV